MLCGNSCTDVVFHLNSLSYFFGDLERLFDPAYVPIEQDIVHTRARTIGITETVFNLRESEMLMVDVGGQKSERRKWIHCFQDVTSILFLVSLSGYDQCLIEDKDAVSFNYPAPLRVYSPCRQMANRSCAESNARCHDHMGLNMSFTMVQTDINCEFSFRTIWAVRIYSSSSVFIDFIPEQGRSLPEED